MFFFGKRLFLLPRLPPPLFCWSQKGSPLPTDRHCLHSSPFSCLLTLSLLLLPDTSFPAPLKIRHCSSDIYVSKQKVVSRFLIFEPVNNSFMLQHFLLPVLQFLLYILSPSVFPNILSTFVSYLFLFFRCSSSDCHFFLSSVPSLPLPIYFLALKLNSSTTFPILTFVL